MYKTIIFTRIQPAKQKSLNIHKIKCWEFVIWVIELVRGQNKTLVQSRDDQKQKSLCLPSQDEPRKRNVDQIQRARIIKIILMHYKPSLRRRKRKHISHLLFSLPSSLSSTSPGLIKPRQKSADLEACRGQLPYHLENSRKKSQD